MSRVYIKQQIHLLSEANWINFTFILKEISILFTYKRFLYLFFLVFIPSCDIPHSLVNFFFHLPLKHAALSGLLECLQIRNSIMYTNWTHRVANLPYQLQSDTETFKTSYRPVFFIPTVDEVQ
jgi:hypothetical protein